MPLNILVITGFVLSIVNYNIGKKDILNPSVLFCGMNFIYSVAALMMRIEYGIDFHYNTFFVFLGGMLIFTFFNLMSNGRVRIRFKNISYVAPIKTYNISRLWVTIFIILEIIVGFFMYKYARDVSMAFYNGAGSISTYLGNMNDIRKNRGAEFISKGIHASPIYVIGWPLCIAFCVFNSAIQINNIVLTKKIDFYKIIPQVLLFFMSFFLGSRSTAFRFATLYIFQYLVIKRWNKRDYRKGQIKSFTKILTVVFVLVVLIGFSVKFLGRRSNIPFFEYVTAYVGAPFYNLDIAINRGINQSRLFGQETFHHLYSFLSARLGKPEWKYTLHIPYIWYKGRYLGNVYTMYYMFIEDFGYTGVVILTSFIALYYNMNYRRIMDYDREYSFLSIRFLIFCYLFNDLLMLTFSNRFYETSLDMTAFLFYFWICIIWYFFHRGLFTINGDYYTYI